MAKPYDFLFCSLPQKQLEIFPADGRHGIATIAFLASLGMFTRSSGPCFWIKPPKLRPVQGWYEEERLVAPEGGAKLRGLHPPKPPKFLMEGRIKNSPLEPQPEAEAVSAETSEVSMLRVEDKQVGQELRYLSLAKQEALPVVGEDVRALVEQASEEIQVGRLLLLSRCSICPTLEGTRNYPEISNVLRMEIMIIHRKME